MVQRKETQLISLLLVVIYLSFISLGLPDSLLGTEYYRPGDQGEEVRFKERLDYIKKWKEQRS